MRIICLGAGGIGGYFGGRLIAAGADVTFLVRPARAALLAERGLVIESPYGDAQLTPQIATEVDRPFDLVLLSCKAYDLDEAIKAIRPAVGKETIVWPVLNGLAHFDKLDQAFDESVIGGLAHISVTLAEDGTIRHLNKLQTLTFGPRTAQQAAACDRLGAALATAPFEIKRSDVILQDLWEKFAFITTGAALTCLMRASIGEILTATDGAALIEQMFDECAAVAAASHYPIRPKARDWGRNFLLQQGSDFTASMLRDLEAGGRIEADHLHGDMIARGEALGVKTPLLRIAYCHLQAYEARRAAGRLFD
jgi:2-dehydropantoate 2-reductase